MNKIWINAMSAMSILRMIEEDGYTEGRLKILGKYVREIRELSQYVPECVGRYKAVFCQIRDVWEGWFFKSKWQRVDGVFDKKSDAKKAAKTAYKRENP